MHISPACERLYDVAANIAESILAAGVYAIYRLLLALPLVLIRYEYGYKTARTAKVIVNSHLIP